MVGHAVYALVDPMGFAYYSGLDTDLIMEETVDGDEKLDYVT